MKIIFEDNDILLIDKPHNYAAHPSKTWSGKTITAKISDRKIKTSGDKSRQGIVHRLDVGTSGLMVIAKNENSYQSLLKQFREHKIIKKYFALVQGYMDLNEAIIKLPISRKKSSFIFEVNESGKIAKTKYKVIEKRNGFSLLDIDLLTGRTHQIRVHFSYLNHPVVGDKLYFSNPTFSKRAKIDRQFLHCYFLAFTHPTTNKKIEFEIKLPNDLQNAYKILFDK